MDIINYIKDWWRDNLLGGINRNSKWSSVRRQYLKQYPKCAVCGKENRFLKSNEVHHIVLFSLDKTKELAFDNLITLCSRDHFLFGHCSLNWKCYNPNVESDAKIINNIINNIRKNGNCPYKQN